MRRHLGLFGISGDLALQRIETLSGGQKSRYAELLYLVTFVAFISSCSSFSVAFALVTWKKPHILIMDEPTNHLDLETIDALILAINGYVISLVGCQMHRRLMYLLYLATVVA